MKFIYITLFGVVLFSLNSCKKFLDEKPTGSLTTDAQITSGPGILALATGPYRSLPAWATDFWSNGLAPAAFEFATGKAGGTAFNSNRGIDFERDIVTGALPYFVHHWNSWFTGVRDCNLSISLISNASTISAADKSKYLGELRTLRAWYYFNLLRYYGDVPLNVSVLTDVNTAQRPRTSLKTIYDKVVIPDLEYAVNESTLADIQSKDGRVTKHVARMILADVYLTCAGYPYQEIAANNDTTKRWCADGLWVATAYPVNSTSAVGFLQKAKVQLDKLYGQYTLGTYADLHNPLMNNKGEAIFQAQFLKGTISNAAIWQTLPMGSTSSTMFTSWGAYVPLKSYYSSYDPADKRVQEREFFFTGDTYAKIWNASESPDPSFNTGNPYLYKFYDRDAFKVDGQSSLNWTFYRYAETLLMLTEVNWTLKELGQAVSDVDILKGINEVRRRALLSEYAISDVNLMSIMSERAYELIYENKMLWDMRRTRKVLTQGNGKFSKLESFFGHTPERFTFSFTAKHLLSPISANEISDNLNAVQNFGY
jgi:hypothetical protein